MKFESKVSGGPSQGNLQIHVPEPVARHLGIFKGDRVVWDVADQQPVKVRKKETK